MAKPIRALALLYPMIQFLITFFFATNKKLQGPPSDYSRLSVEIRK